MLSVLVPGLGPVEVENEESLRILQGVLTNHLSKSRKIAQDKADEPNKIVEAIERAQKANKALLEQVVKEVAKIEPAVTVEAPIVNVEAPNINVPYITVPTPKVTVQIPKTKPIKKVTARNISRDGKGLINNVDFVVTR